MPHLGRMLISDESKCYFIPTISGDKRKGRMEMVSVVQVEKNLGRATRLPLLLGGSKVCRISGSPK